MSHAKKMLQKMVVALIALGMTSIAFAGSLIHASRPQLAELNIHWLEGGLAACVVLMVVKLAKAYHAESA